MRVALKGCSANYALLLFTNQLKITIMITIISFCLVGLMGLTVISSELS